MKTFEQWLNDNFNESMPAGSVNAEWFVNRNLPMIVECTCCTMTMALPSAMIDDDDYIYCSTCAGTD